MTVNTTESAPICHQAHQHAEDRGESVRGGSASIVAVVRALPRTVKIVGGAVLGFGVLLAVGVPLATLTPLIAVGGCLSMHLFMGHGMMHGDHAGHDSGATQTGSRARQEADSQR